jgi:pectin methylesterase-like acyl-CoA thioesterase
MNYYLKNTSGVTVFLHDLGIVLKNNTSIPILASDIGGWLSNDLMDALNTQSELILSTTDLPDSSGDLEPSVALAALSVVSKNDDGTSIIVTLTQAIQADTNTDITTEELELLTNGSNINLHNHDSRYYTKEQLSASNTANIHWDNIKNVPALSAPEWQAPVYCFIKSFATSAPSGSNGDFYVNENNNTIYKYSGSWKSVDTNLKRVIYNNKIYQFNGTWVQTNPSKNWTVYITDDGDGNGAQYNFTGTGWIKIADADWGNHDSLTGKDTVNSHPATAISFNKGTTGLNATNVQDAIRELSISRLVDASNIYVVAKNGDDVAGTGAISNPFKTIQKAFSSSNSAAANNPFVILIMPGFYDETINLNKGYIYLSSYNKEAVTIGTLTISNDTQCLYNISVNNLIINNTATNNISNMIISNLTINNGSNYIDNSIIQNVSTISGGTTTIKNSYFKNTINQTDGLVRYISGQIDSASLDYNLTSGTLYWGLIEHSKNINLAGEFHLLSKASDITFDGTITLQNTILELKDITNELLGFIISHEAKTNNPHNVTYDQIITNSGTDITPAELEKLSDNSDAAGMHYHKAIDVPFNKETTAVLNTNNVQESIDFVASNYHVNPKNVIFVAKNGNDVELNNGTRGSAPAPYLTINAALNRIEYNYNNTINNPYVIWVGPGIYNETILLNDSMFVDITFIGNNTTIVSGESLTDSVRSSLMNNNLSKLEFRNFIFKHRVYIEGATDHGNTFNTGCTFNNCVFNAFTCKNITNLEFNNIKFLGNNNIENSLITYNNCVMPQLDIQYAAVNNRPADNSVINIYNTTITSSYIIRAGAILNAYNSNIGISGLSSVFGVLSIYYGSIYNIKIQTTGQLITHGTFFDLNSFENNGIWSNNTNANMIKYNNTTVAAALDNILERLEQANL